MLSRWKYCATCTSTRWNVIRKSDLANEISGAFVVDAGKTPGEPFVAQLSDSLSIELFDSESWFSLISPVSVNVERTSMKAKLPEMICFHVI